MTDAQPQELTISLNVRQAEHGYFDGPTFGQQTTVGYPSSGAAFMIGTNNDTTLRPGTTQVQWKIDPSTQWSFETYLIAVVLTNQGGTEQAGGKLDYDAGDFFSAEGTDTLFIHQKDYFVPAGSGRFASPPGTGWVAVPPPGGCTLNVVDGIASKTVEFSVALYFFSVGVGIWWAPSSVTVPAQSNSENTFFEPVGDVPTTASMVPGAGTAHDTNYFDDWTGEPDSPTFPGLVHLDSPQLESITVWATGSVIEAVGATYSYLDSNGVRTTYPSSTQHPTGSTATPVTVAIDSNNPITEVDVYTAKYDNGTFVVALGFLFQNSTTKNFGQELETGPTQSFSPFAQVLLSFSGFYNAPPPGHAQWTPLAPGTTEYLCALGCVFTPIG